jgi:hypothetical protein
MASCNLDELSEGCPGEIGHLILKFIWKCEEPRRVKTTLTKNESGKWNFFISNYIKPVTVESPELESTVSGEQTLGERLH